MYNGINSIVSHSATIGVWYNLTSHCLSWNQMNSVGQYDIEWYLFGSWSLYWNHYCKLHFKWRLLLTCLVPTENKLDAGYIGPGCREVYGRCIDYFLWHGNLLTSGFMIRTIIPAWSAWIKGQGSEHCMMLSRFNRIHFLPVLVLLMIFRPSSFVCV